MTNLTILMKKFLKINKKRFLMQIFKVKVQLKFSSLNFYLFIYLLEFEINYQENIDKKWILNVGRFLVLNKTT